MCVLFVCGYVCLYVCVYIYIYIWLCVHVYYHSLKCIFLQTISWKIVHKIKTALLLFLHANFCDPLNCVITEMRVGTDIQPLSPETRFRFRLKIFAIFMDKVTLGLASLRVICLSPVSMVLQAMCARPSIHSFIILFIPFIHSFNVLFIPFNSFNVLFIPFIHSLFYSFN